MGVPDDRREATVSPPAKSGETVGHMLVPVVDQDARKGRARPAHLRRVLLGRLHVPIHLPLDHPGRDEEAHERAREERDPFFEGHGANEVDERRPDRVIDQEEREIPFPSVDRGRLHFRAGKTASDLRPEAALDEAPETGEQRAPRAAGVIGLRSKEGVGALRVELDGDPVQGPVAEQPTQRVCEVDDMGRSDQEDRCFGRSRVHDGFPRGMPLISMTLGQFPYRRGGSGGRMTWTIFSVPSSHRTELDSVLKDDLVSRQSQKVREAGALGGPADALYVLVEGANDAVRRAEELLGPVGTRLPMADAEVLYRRFKDEEDAASQGMGLFFTEG